MKLPDLLVQYSRQMTEERERAMSCGLDSPITITQIRHVRTIGTLHLYGFTLPAGRTLIQDVPVTILPESDEEPTEGYVLDQQGSEALILTLDSIGRPAAHCTIIPDTSGFFETCASRLGDMASKPEAFDLGPAERLVPWLAPDPAIADPQARASVSPSILTTVWGEDRHQRWATVGPLLVEQARQNTRVLLIGPDQPTADAMTALTARALRTAALPIKSLLSRYEIPLGEESGGVVLHEFGFEAHMHQFYAKANANKTSLRKKYERFRELTPVLAYKRDKQKDLREVKLLEWRLLTELSEWQGKIRHIDSLVADYEAIPIWKRIAMQAAGKNVETLGEYRKLYEEKIRALMGEVEIAQRRIRELTPEAAIPKDMRPEYEELKEEITRLGGTKKIRDMLAAGEGTNRQAFIQNKRILATTSGRVLLDPVFRRVRFDVLIVEDAPRIPAPLLLGVAGIIRTRIVLTGNPKDFPKTADPPTGVEPGLWLQPCLPEELGATPHPSEVG